MKTSLVRAVLSLVLLPPASALAQTNQTFASSWFYSPDGSTGIVSVIRDVPLGITQLYYSFCTETIDTSCDEGNGFISNAAFAGSVGTSLNKGTVLTLGVDTSQVPGFSNWVC